MDECRENPTPEQPPVQEWATDLTRDDYITMNTTLSKLRGPLRLRKAQLVISLVFFAAMMLLCVYEWLALDSVDWLTLLLGGGLLLASLLLWWYAPRHMRKAAAKAYDNTKAGGYIYAGVVRVRENRIEKETPQGVSVIKLDHMTLFIETPELLAFLTNGGQFSIVLPARYLTPEAASVLRQAADKLPFRNRRFVGRIQPGGESPAPAAPAEDTVLWEKTVRYEPEEMAEILRDITKKSYIKRLPFYAIISILCAVGMAGEVLQIGGMIFRFLAFFGALTLFSLVMPLRRVKMMAMNADGASRTVTIRLTDRGVWLRGQASNFTVLPWTAVEHVINRDTFVEITRGQQSIRIPKTYIDDLAAFDTMISGCWTKTNSK